MEKMRLLERLAQIGIHSNLSYNELAFSRNIGLLSRDEQDLLSGATIAIPGMGGVGGSHLLTLVRTGIGRFHLSDFDLFEPVNINRQAGATTNSFGRPKLSTMIEQARSINPFLDIKPFPEGVNETNINEFLNGVDIVVDSLDYFAFETRRLLFNTAREKGIYVITAGPMGFSSALLVFAPDAGMSFDEYFNITAKMDMTDKYIAFGLGLAPRPTHFRYVDFASVDIDSQKGPSSALACQLCSGMAATEVLRIVLKRGKIRPAPYYSQFDPFTRQYKTGRLFLGNRHPIQALKIKTAKKLVERKRKQYRTKAPKAPSVITPDTPIPGEAIQYLIRAGIQAPSGDNAQPWKFSSDQNRIRLFLDSGADTSFFNVRQSASYISCGAVLENIATAAASISLKADIRFPDDDGNGHIADVHLTPSSVKDALLAPQIWKRETNRRPFQKKPLSPSVIAAIREVAVTFPGIRAHVLTEKEGMKRLGDLIYDVDRIRSEFKPLHEHLNKMIRFSKNDAKRRLDGLPLKNLEAGFAGETILRATRPWSVMNLANKAGLGRLIAHVSRQGILNSGGAILLTAPGLDTRSFIQGGQALEKIWLTLTRKGVAMQPMTAITLFRNRWQLEGSSSFQKNHRERLPDIWDRYRALFPDVDFDTEGHIMLFRAGYGKGVRFNTYRKQTESLLLRPENEVIL